MQAPLQPMNPMMVMPNAQILQQQQILNMTLPKPEMPFHIQVLFSARPRLPYVKPVQKQKCRKLDGMLNSDVDYVDMFEDYDPPEKEKIENTRERRLRIRKKKLKEQYILNKDLIKNWNPHQNEKATEDPMKTLFVSRLNYETTEKKLKRDFEIYGPIKQIKLIKDSKTNKSKGYAFIEYEHKRDFIIAYKQADGRKIDGKRVVVDFERGRTVKDWKPRRLGGGKGETRKGKSEDRDLISKSRSRSQSKRRSKSDDRKKNKKKSGKEKDQSKSKQKYKDKEYEKESERKKDKKADKNKESKHKDKDKEKQKEKEKQKQKEKENQSEQKNNYKNEMNQNSLQNETSKMNQEINNEDIINEDSRDNYKQQSITKDEKGSEKNKEGKKKHQDKGNSNKEKKQKDEKRKEQRSRSASRKERSKKQKSGKDQHQEKSKDRNKDRKEKKYDRHHDSKHSKYEEGELN